MSMPPIVYVDSSVMLRHILGDVGAYGMVKQLDRIWSSELLRVEVLRTIDRSRIVYRWGDEEVARRLQVMIAVLAPLQEVSIQMPILREAGRPMSTTVGTLDAIHIATALLVREQNQQDLLFLTHDRRQGIAAMAAGLTVEGF